MCLFFFVGAGYDIVCVDVNSGTSKILTSHEREVRWKEPVKGSVSHDPHTTCGMRSAADIP